MAPLMTPPMAMARRGPTAFLGELLGFSVEPSMVLEDGLDVSSPPMVQPQISERLFDSSVHSVVERKPAPAASATSLHRYVPVAKYEVAYTAVSGMLIDPPGPQRLQLSSQPYTTKLLYMRLAAVFS
jgi:hypothetical protein